MSDAEPLTSIQVCKQLDVSYRQLNYWVIRGYVPQVEASPGPGVPRLFNEAAVARVKEIRDALSACAVILRKAGLDAFAKKVDPDGRSSKGYALAGGMPE